MAWLVEAVIEIGVICLTQGLRFHVNAFSHVGKNFIPHSISAAKRNFEHTNAADTTSSNVVCQ
jgi:hypothetical protein